MHASRLKPVRALAFASLLAVGATAPFMVGAQTSADAAALKGFTLDSGFLHQWEAVKQGVVDQGIRTPPMMGEASLSDRVQAVDGNPKMHALLASNDLSARDYVVGSFAMADAMRAGLTGQPAASNPENVAFFKAHRAEIMEFIRASASR